MAHFEEPSTPRGTSSRNSTMNTITWKQNTANRCKACGLRIRSEKHEDGTHHKSKSSNKKQ